MRAVLKSMMKPIIVLQELETCHWFCQSCNVKMGKVVPNIVKLSDRVTEIDGRVEKLQQGLKVLCGRNTKLEAKLTGGLRSGNARQSKQR